MVQASGATKRCARCKLVKATGHFTREARAADGLHARCRDCKRAMSRAYSAKPKARPASKVCRDCGLDKPVVEFYANPQNRDGLMSRCKACQNLYGAARSARLGGAILVAKTCGHCHQFKQRAEFPAKFDSRDGLTVRCKACHASYSRKILYNLTAEQYQRMRDKQANACAICGDVDPPRGLFVDHNHTTGAVRALLCHACNSAAGYVRDSPAIAEQLRVYLLAHSGGPVTDGGDDA